MKRILISLLFLVLPVAATAQQATVASPDVSLTANSGNANLYNGWPLIVNVTIMNSTALSNSPTPLLIAPPNGVWTDAIQFTVTSASGQPVQWPLKLVGTPENPTLTLTQNDYVRVSFQASATDVATFAPGDYQLSATIQVAGSNGWNGTVSTIPVTITVGPEPTLTADLQAEKTILLAGFAVNSGDDITAITLTQQLQQAQPDNPAAAIIAADTLSYAGYPALALTEGGEALATFYRINPNAPEPPTDLLTEQQFLFGLFATPDAETPTLTAVTSPSLIFSPAAQTASLSSTITAASSVEGGTVTFTVANIGAATSGLVAGGVTSSTLTVPGGTHPGSYQIQAAYSGTTAFASSSGAGTLTIGRATPLITWNNPSGIAAGTALGSTQLNATANVPGTFIYSPPAGTVLTAGAAQTLAVTFTPTDVADYNSASASVSIDVTQAQAAHLVVSAVSASRRYGQANPAFTASYSGFANGDTVAVLSGVLSCTSSATPASPVSGSPYPVTCSGLTSNKYTISYVPGTLTIGPAPLTATANNSSIQYGKAIQLSGASYSGFVNGDTATSLVGTLNCVSSATQASSAGTYAVTCSGTSSTNYAISFVQGLLTITPASLTIKANDASRAVGAANPPLNNVTATGFVNNDKLSSLAGTLTCTTVATTTSPAGSYPIVCTGFSSTNYSITYLPGTLQITSSTLTVTAASVARQYGSANPTFAATFAGFTNGDSAASLGGRLTCATNATTTSSVSGGPYPINCSGLTSTKYAINYVAGTLTISPIPLVVAANNASRPYGANNPPLTGTITGLLNADSLTASFSTLATPASTVGTYPIQPVIAASPSVLSNYIVSPVGAVLSVVPEKTSLAVTVVPSSIGVNQSSTVTITLTAPDMVIPIAPGVLAGVTVDSPVSTDVLTNNGVCTPVAGTLGMASCVITITAMEPNGRTLSADFPGTAALTASTASANLMVTTPVSGTKSCITSDFRNIPVRGGDYLWFNSIFRVRHARREMITLSFSQATVDFHYRGAGGKIISVHQPVPGAKIIIDPKIKTASTKFDSTKNIWITTVPFDRDDDVFLSGMPWQVPSGGIPGNIEPVTWCGTFSSDENGVDVGWRWAAAAYRQFSNQNNVLGVRVADDEHRDRWREEDRAGTPENFKRFVIPGARGFGGRNYTGTYTRGKEVD